MTNMFLFSFSWSASKFLTNKFMNIIFPIFNRFIMVSWLMNNGIFDKTISDITFIKFFFFGRTPFIQYKHNIYIIG